MTGLLNFI